MTPCSFFFFFFGFFLFLLLFFSLPAGSDRYKRILSTACLVRVRRAKYSMCWINEQEGDVGHGGGSGLCLYKQSCQMSPCPALQGCLHHPDPRGTVNPPAGAAWWLMARRESRGGAPGLHPGAWPPPPLHFVGMLSPAPHISQAVLIAQTARRCSIKGFTSRLCLRHQAQISCGSPP